MELALRLFQDAAHDVGFTLAHADLVLDLALSDDWLLNAADVLVGIDRRNVHRKLQRYLVGAVNVRRDVDVDADIDVVELRIDQRIDAHAADARLKRSGSHWNTLSDLERCLLAVEGANLRLLQDLRIAVVVQERRRRRWHRYLEIRRVQVRQAVQVNVRRRCCRWSW